MSDSGRSQWSIWLTLGVKPLDYASTDPMCSAWTGYRHPDVIPEALLHDLFEKKPMREIGNPYRFRRQT